MCRPVASLKGLRKTTKNVSEDGRFLGRYFRPRLPRFRRDIANRPTATSGLWHQECMKLNLYSLHTPSSCGDLGRRKCPFRPTPSTKTLTTLRAGDTLLDRFRSTEKFSALIGSWYVIINILSTATFDFIGGRK
jgi:hypothetical protein